MRLVRKTVLKEAEANPLETIDVDLSYDEQYKQAILKAIASETSAYTEYSQIIAIEPHVSEKSLVDKFHDTLVDISNEEMKHIAQLTTKISEVPGMKDAYEAGKKEAETGVDKENSEEKDENSKEKVTESVMLTEAVQPNRLYDSYTVQQIIADNLGLNDAQYEKIEDIFRYADDELTAEQVDGYIQEVRSIFTMSDAKLDRIENDIIASTDPQISRQNEFKDDIQSDIYNIENTMENVYSVAAKEKLYQVIQYLKGLEYNGDRDIGWTTKHSIFGGDNPKKKIIA